MHLNQWDWKSLKPVAKTQVLRLHNLISKYPHLLAGLLVGLAMVGVYATSGFGSKSEPKALWSDNPLIVSFSGSSGIGSSGTFEESFKCAPPISAVTLRSTVSNPSKVSFLLTQSNFVSCGPSFTIISLVVRCLVSATLCRGSYSGMVYIFQASPYGIILPTLEVKIIVT